MQFTTTLWPLITMVNGGNVGHILFLLNWVWMSTEQLKYQGRRSWLLSDPNRRLNHESFIGPQMNEEDGQYKYWWFIFNTWLPDDSASTIAKRIGIILFGPSCWSPPQDQTQACYIGDGRLGSSTCLPICSESGILVCCHIITPLFLMKKRRIPWIYWTSIACI